MQHSASAHSCVGSESRVQSPSISQHRSTAKSPLLHEPKLLPRELNQSDEEDDEDDDEEEENDNDDYVAAVCQYTTVLKETPPGFDDNKYEVNFMNMDQGTTEDIERNMVKKTSKSEGVRISETDEEKRRHLSHHVRLNSGDSQRQSSERRIEYCEDDEEEEDEVAGHLAVSGKLAIHLDTGETSREFCLNRLDTESSQRTYTRDERCDEMSFYKFILFITQESDT